MLYPIQVPRPGNIATFRTFLDNFFRGGRKMASVDQKKAVLSKVPLFGSLKDKQLGRLADRMVERSYASGDMIVKQGQGGEGFYVVVRGKAEATRERTDGEKILVNHFEAGDFFGELALLDEEGVRTASIVANEPTTCLVLTRWDFLATLRQDADMAVDILQEMARRFRIALNSL
jgi:CRP/FNR family transcriptional regulator